MAATMAATMVATTAAVARFFARRPWHISRNRHPREDVPLADADADARLGGFPHSSDSLIRNATAGNNVKLVRISVPLL
jgi:hypothetical protein